MANNIRYNLRDENATELNQMLEELLSNLDEIANEIAKAMSYFVVGEGNKTNRDPYDLVSNVEDALKYNELNTQREMINPIRRNVRHILYKSAEMKPVLEKKTIAPYVKREDYPVWIMENVAPLIKQGKSFTECAEILNISTGNLSTKVQVFDGWNNFVNMVNNLNGDVDGKEN